MVSFVIAQRYKKTATPAFARFAEMCPSVGTVLKKAKPLNKLRPDERGSPFAVRVLAFLTTSLSAWRPVVSFFQSVEKGSSRKKNVGASSNKNEKNDT